jgi:NADH-quinone oxidoreductase subunit J
MSIAGFIISFFAIVSGLGVVAFRNPLFSAFSLVVNLLAVAALYAVLGAHFLAASQVMVYAGAIMVLVLFVLMLLNLKTESGREFSVFKVALLGVAGALCFVIVVPILFSSFGAVPQYQLAQNAAANEGTVKAIGLELYQRYVVHFELASLVILVGVVGAVMLANRRKGEMSKPNTAEVTAAAERSATEPSPWEQRQARGGKV